LGARGIVYRRLFLSLVSFDAEASRSSAVHEFSRLLPQFDRVAVWPEFNNHGMLPIVDRFRFLERRYPR
jgi:hypothetical protein